MVSRGQAPFDVSSVDDMRRLAEHSGTPGHIYPLALLCHDIMPPPPQIEKEIGEERVISFHGVGLSVAPGINFSEIAAVCENPEEAKETYTKVRYNSVTEQYNVLKSAIHGAFFLDIILQFNQMAAGAAKLVFSARGSLSLHIQ